MRKQYSREGRTDAKTQEAGRQSQRPYDLGRSVSIIKYIQGQPPIYGLDEEDLETVARQYSNVASMYDATTTEKMKAVSVMLKGATLSVLTRKSVDCEICEDSLGLFHICHKSIDRHGRLFGP